MESEPGVVTDLRHSASQLSAEQSAELVAAYASGEAALDLGLRFGLSPRAVRSHIHRAGVPLRQKVKLTRGDAAELVRLYQAGATGRGLAKRFACSERTVLTELRRAGVQPRPRGRRPGNL